MEEKAAYVVLTEQPSALHAHWIAGAVEAEGIPTYVEEDGLADEFAVSQKVMGLSRVRVLVPADRLTEAQTIFLDLSQPIPLVDEDKDEDAEEKDQVQVSAKMAVVIVVGVALAFLGVVLLIRG